MYYLSAFAAPNQLDSAIILVTLTYRKVHNYETWNCCGSMRVYQENMLHIGAYQYLDSVAARKLIYTHQAVYMWSVPATVVVMIHNQHP